MQKGLHKHWIKTIYRNTWTSVANKYSTPEVTSYMIYKFHSNIYTFMINKNTMVKVSQ